MNRRIALTCCLFFATGFGCAGPKVAPLQSSLAPAKAVSVEKVDASIARGIDYLLAAQNEDGSWGSATQTKDLNIFAPIPGAHHGFRMGTTALCISALVETGGEDPRVIKALDKAETFAIGYMGRVRRADPIAIYNVWAHLYGIQALVRLLDRPGVDTSDSDRREKLIAMIDLQIKLLDRYMFVGGGWGYYDFDNHTQKPGGEPTSFTTGAVLVAFYEAKQVGIDVPERLIERGFREVLRQRSPNGTLVYSRGHTRRPMGDINRPGGSLGRSQLGNLVVNMYGRPELGTDEDIRLWLDRLFTRQGWLDIGRKRPRPHESWFAVAGYFYYFGHYYAAYTMHLLPPEQRAIYQTYMAQTMMDRQEKDGSWFDFPLYAYHKPYGTAYALMIMQRSRVGQAPPPIPVLIEAMTETKTASAD